MSLRKRVLLVTASVSLVAVTAVVIVFLRWYIGFEHRLDLAAKHARIVQHALEADGRFAEIHVGSFTGDDGCLLVQAWAPRGAEEDLKRIVEATSPPVFVRYDITEGKPASSQLAR